MIPTTGDSFAANGSGVIATSDPSRRTSSSFTIRTTGIAASRGKRPCKSSKKMASGRSSRLPGINYPRSALKSRREPSPSSVSSAVTKSWISSDQKLDIFGEHFTVPKSLIYSYVRGKIVTAFHQIQLYRGDELVTTFPYRLPSWMDANS